MRLTKAKDSMTIENQICMRNNIRLSEDLYLSKHMNIWYSYI